MCGVSEASRIATSSFVPRVDARARCAAASPPARRSQELSGGGCKPVEEPIPLSPRLIAGLSSSASAGPIGCTSGLDAPVFGAFDFGDLPGFLGVSRILRHQPNMGRIRLIEKGKAPARTAPRSIVSRCQHRNVIASGAKQSIRQGSKRGLLRSARNDEKGDVDGLLFRPATSLYTAAPDHPDEFVRRQSARQNQSARRQAGHPSMLVNIPRLVTAYFAGQPDPAIAAQRVAFGTSGHRGSAFDTAFNEAHILAITQAICEYRRSAGIAGPLFIGIDTHALSEPALASALEVFAANGVEVMIDAAGRLHADAGDLARDPDLQQRPQQGLADGIVITPSHNPPEDGGFKYNPPNGGPADTDVTGWIENAANDLLEDGLDGVKRIPYERARKAACVHRHDYITPYVADLANVVDMEAIRAAGVKIGIDPLGGAAVHYWQPIIERYGSTRPS